jgi:RecB family exonuclease
VSPSALDRFVGCELRWLMESVGARGSEQAAQSVGTALHDVAAAAVTDGVTDPDELGTRLEDALDRLDLGGAWTTRRERARARDMLTTFLRWERSSRSRWVLVDVEAPFSVEIPPESPDGHPAVLTGRIDRLERERDGRLVVVDLKTGRSKPAESELARHPQLGAYQLAVASGAFGPAEPGGGVLVNLGTAAERNRTQDQLPLGEDADPEWARARVREAAQGMGGAVFQARPGAFCRVCATRSSCPANDSGRQVTE